MTELYDWLTTLVFAFVRPLGMAFFFPLFNSGNLGGSLIRNGVLIAIILPILPMLYLNPELHAKGTWPTFLLTEIIVGVLLGFCLTIPFWAVDMAGFLIDTLRGATMGTLFNPSLGAQTSIFGLLFTQFLFAFFLLGGGFDQVLTLLYSSYQYIPPGKPLVFDQSLLDFLLGIWQSLYRLCLSFSMPAVICMVMADLALGLINRSAQQLNVFFLSMPIKSAVALFLLLLSLPFAFRHYLVQREELYRHFSEMIHTL